jgi:hypothetical protein
MVGRDERLFIQFRKERVEVLPIHRFETTININQPTMILSPKIRKYWASVKFDKKYIAPWKSVLRPLAALLFFCAIAYLIWLPIDTLFTAVSGLFSHRPQPAIVLPPGAE